MGSFKYYIKQIYLFFFLRNFILYKLKFFYSFFKVRDQILLKKNILKIKNNKKLKSKDLAIVCSNLNFNNLNNLLLISSLMSYFRNIEIKPHIFNAYQYKEIFKKVDFSTSKHLIYFSSLSFFKVKQISNNIINKGYQSILSFKYNNVACGKYAVSSTMRNLRVSHINLKNHDHARSLLFNLRKSILYANAAKNFLNNHEVKYALFNDRGYCGEGELYDLCIERNIKCIQFIATYKNNNFLLKKLTKKNKNDHPSAISKKVWNSFTNKNVSNIQLNYLKNEIENSYRNNTWFSSAGTMVGKNIISKKDILTEIGIKNDDKKIAVIFPHILWDGTFFYGDDLYESYEAWFKKTLKIAEKNKNINWIIKAHPSNVVKNKQENIAENNIEPELKFILEMFGEMPTNFFYIEAYSKINTFYLLDILDFCFTVRGTVALEAAIKNKISIVTGTGKYDDKQFVYYVNNKLKYKNLILNLPNFSMYHRNQIDNALKFAYASLICKNFQPSNINFYYEKTLYSDLKVELKPFRKKNKNFQDDKYLEWLKNEKEDFFYDPKLEWNLIN
jgi:hypothetical protein